MMAKLGNTIPPGMCVLHKCDQPACVNPDHLFLGSRADNSRDMAIKNRTGCRKLQPKDVLDIRELITKKVKQLEIAKSYGVSRGLIQRIVSKKIWKHI